jgi:N utilization substance protein B
MISRRNIRVKVMQCIYAGEAESVILTEKDAIPLLNKYLDQAANLFTFSIFLLTEVARYAEIHAKNKASKHLPTQDDLNINVKIAGNTILWQILESKSFQAAVKKGKYELLINQDLVKKIYLRLSESEIYQTYIQELSREKKTEKELLSYIFTDLIMADDDVTEFLEELFIQWDDDAEMIYQMVLNFLSKPGTLDTKDIIGNEKYNYALSLLKTTIQKKDFTLEIIKPKLNNWDADRIAQLDMIIIRLGICEFLYFETIPTKVTINEYIDIAKSYSTQQSGQFVNGILDSIHKELLAEGKLKKIDFKKQA